MAVAAVTKAIKDLKTDADKLSPKPSTVFDSLHKLQSGAVISAAKAIDTAIADKDASAAPAAQKKFNDAASRFFDSLGKAATKEPAATKGKLNALVDAAEKEALAACKSEVDAFVKSMTGLARSADAAVDALKEHIDLCKRGVKGGHGALRGGPESSRQCQSQLRRGRGGSGRQPEDPPPSAHR